MAKWDPLRRRCVIPRSGGGGGFPSLPPPPCQCYSSLFHKLPDERLSLNLLGSSLSPRPFYTPIQQNYSSKGAHNKDAPGLRYCITFGREEVRIALFADDILIFTSAPAHNLLVIQSIFSEFGQFAGLCIHFGKSEVLTLREGEGAMAGWDADCQGSYPY